MLKLLKNIIRRFCHKLFQFSLEYEYEKTRKKFNIPKSVSIYKVSLEGNVVIGEHTYINEGSRVDSGSNSRIVIGKHCAIGRYAHITSKTHPLSCPTTDEQHFEVVHEEADVIIGNYVWIGDKVTVLPGIKIGDYAIVGAHSLVLNDVKPFEIVGGVPASHLKFNTSHYRYREAGSDREV